MHRRDMLKSALVAATGVAGLDEQATAATETVPAQKVVYHLSEVSRVQFVLSNMRNHIDAMDGPGQLAIALVVHGPPLAAFRADTANDAIKDIVAGFHKGGARLYACINTMRGMKLALSDLLPGFDLADKGGVVKLTQLQMQGWAYLRP